MTLHILGLIDHPANEDNLSMQRLREYLGDHFSTVTWANASPRQPFHPDPERVLLAIEKTRPSIILTFGKTAEKALSMLVDYHGEDLHIWWPGPLLSGPHPAFINNNTGKDLQLMVSELDKLIQEWSEFMLESPDAA